MSGLFNREIIHRLRIFNIDFGSSTLPVRVTQYGGRRDSLMYATRRAKLLPRFYDAINLLRASQLISSVTKSHSGHEFSHGRV